MKLGKRIFIIIFAMVVILSLAGCNATADRQGDITTAASQEDDLTDASREENPTDESSDADLTDASYEDNLFDASVVHDIDITISEEDWNKILENPFDKPKAYVSATIDGETYEDVRFSPKGNSSLFITALEYGERYSFKLKFGSQTYHGLDEFVLNNSFEDPSYMRDYASAWLFKQQGVPTVLMSFTKLSINGELYGLYMAAETEDDSFLERVFDGEGTLYKPESEVLKARDEKVIEGIKDALANGEGMEYFEEHPIKDLNPDYTTPGADLKYTDDDPESYSDILDNDITNADDTSNAAVIKALKNLSEGNYEEAIDTDEVMRYFAVHNFVCNSDGYTSTMLHNYVLYENGGILQMIPWDYNAAMRPERMVTGGTDGWSWSEIVNMGIDSPTYQEVALSNRPMLGWIFEDESAYKQYTETLGQIADTVESGEFTEEMDRMYELIRPYIAEDPTAFYTAEESEESYQELISFCTSRAESIDRQLNGRLEKLTAKQNLSDRVPWPGGDE